MFIFCVTCRSDKAVVRFGKQHFCRKLQSLLEFTEEVKFRKNHIIADIGEVPCFAASVRMLPPFHVMSMVGSTDRQGARGKQSMVPSPAMHKHFTLAPCAFYLPLKRSVGMQPGQEHIHPKKGKQGDKQADNGPPGQYPATPALGQAQV